MMRDVLQAGGEFILFGVEARFSIDIVETAHRAGITIRAGILTGTPDWDLAGVTAVDLADIPADWLDLPFLVTGFPGARKQRLEQAHRAGFRHLVSVADPTAILPQSLSLAPGCFVNAGAAIGGQTTFGQSVLINRLAAIGHHVEFDDFVSVGPGASVASRVRIGAGTMIGAGATIVEGVTIGSNVIVAAGASIHRDVPSNALAAGNPFEIKKTGITGYRGLSV